MDWSTTCRPRWATPRDERRRTIGGEVGRVADRLGQSFMEWQQYVADVSGEIDPKTGLLVYRTIIITVPRQSGKTTFILAKAIHRAIGFGMPQKMVYTAQSRVDARDKLSDDMWPIVEASPYSRITRLSMNNGSEALRFSNRSFMKISATHEKAGHGKTLDEGYVDEAFHLTDSRADQAFRPAMITRPQPQLFIVSTAGTVESHYFNDKVDAGRAAVENGVNTGVAYFEWSAPEDVDEADRAAWRLCMPALGHTIDEERIAEELILLRDKPGEFRRAYLNIRDERRGAEVFPPGRWESCLDVSSKLKKGGRALGFDVTPDRAWASFVVVGLNKAGKKHIELVKHDARTHWAPAYALKMVREHGFAGVALDPSGPAGALIEDFGDVGVEVLTPTAREVAQASGSLYDAVVDGSLVHLGQDELDAAIAGASKRNVGDAFTWSRRDSTVDISPLVAATVGLWAVRSAPQTEYDLASSVY